MIRGTKVATVMRQVPIIPRRMHGMHRMEVRCASTIRRFMGDENENEDMDGYEGDNEDCHNLRRLERSFAQSTSSFRLRAEDVRHLLFCKTDKVYDVDLDREKGMLIIRTSTYLPEKETAVYMAKLSTIVADLNSWHVGERVRDALKSMQDGPITSEVVIELGINSARSCEWGT